MADGPVTDTKKLRKASGQSGAVTLSGALLEAAGLAVGDTLVLSVQDGAIVVSRAGATPAGTDPTRAAGRATLEQYRWAIEELGKETYGQGA